MANTKRISILLALFFTSTSALIGEIQFESYIDLKSPHARAAINAGAFKKGCVVNLSAGDFTFAEDDFGHIIIGGIEASVEELAYLVTELHGKNALVKITFGNKNYPLSPYLKDTIDVKYLSTAMAKAVYQYGFDGIDVDFSEAIVDPELEICFVRELRNLVGIEKIITISLPGQALTQNYSHVVSQLAGVVNFFNVMGFNLWVEEGSSYLRQIQSDVMRCMQNWQLSPQQVQIGLLPGNDEMNPPNCLKVEEAKAIAHFAKTTGLCGVALADYTRDCDATEGIVPHSFATALMAVLFDGVVPPPIIEEPKPLPPIPPAPIVPPPVEDELPDSEDNDEDFFDDSADDKPLKPADDLDDFE
jgi:hypothetical protein